MNRFTPATLLAGTLACLAVPLAIASEPTADQLNPAHLRFAAGVYHCELNRTVDVRQVSPDLRTAVLRWGRKDYTLHEVLSQSGALRYEDATSGLVWLIITGKSILLDSKNGKQLANECKA